MSPPFHVNLVYGLRFLQGSLLIPMYKKNDQPPRSLPITFKEVPALKKPGKRGTDEDWRQYKINCKEINLSKSFVYSIFKTRKTLDKAGAQNKELIVTVDGSFCNQTCMGAEVERTCLVARARKDAKLCFKEKLNPKKFYSDIKFTPEMIKS